MRMELSKWKKTWVLSNRYKKLRTKHTELCRINATNRHLAINEDVNDLRSLGDIFVTEPKNAKKLQKKAKTGKRKKRFGRSIKIDVQAIFRVRLKGSSESMLKCQMTIRQVNMIIRVMNTLRNHCHKECINCKMEQWYKEIYIHHSFCTALI